MTPGHVWTGAEGMPGMPEPRRELPEPGESRIDRRAAFFAIAAVVCLILVPIIEQEFTWVPVGLAVVYAGLAVASFLDNRTRVRRQRRR